MNIVTGLVHSHRKAVQTLNAKDVKTSSTLELEALKALIETELQRRGEAKNYLVKRVSKDSIIVQESEKAESEEGPCFMPPRTNRSLTFLIDAESIFHQNPEPGNVFLITLRDGDVVDVAKRVALHV